MTALTLLTQVQRFFRDDPARFLPEMWNVVDAHGAPVPACARTAARWSLYGALVKRSIEQIADAETRMAVFAEAEQLLDGAAMQADPREASIFDYAGRPGRRVEEIDPVLEDAIRRATWASSTASTTTAA